MRKEEIKNDIYKLRRHQVANNNPLTSFTHPRIETVRLDSVINIEDRIVLTPIPPEVAALIEYQKETVKRDGRAKQKLSPRECEKLSFDVREAVEWTSENYGEYCDAYANGYVVVEEPEYRVKIGGLYFKSFDETSINVQRDISPKALDGVPAYGEEEAKRMAFEIGGEIERVEK